MSVVLHQLHRCLLCDRWLGRIVAVREGLGAWAYHLAALPIGLLAAPLALFASSVTRRPLDAVSAAAGAVLLVVLLWGVQLVVSAGSTGRPTGEVAAPGPKPGLKSFLVASGGMVGLGAVLGFLGLSATNYDSISSYWPLGVEMNRTGAFDVLVASSRGPLLPAMNAIHVAFGVDWAYVVYPLLGAMLVSWLGLRCGRGRSRTRVRAPAPVQGPHGSWREELSRSCCSSRRIS